MDKEKQIEEMAIANMIQKYLENNDIYVSNRLLPLHIEDMLIRNNFIKINENEVVISKETYEMLTKDRADFDNFARSICDIRMSKGKPIATFEDLQEYIETQLTQARKEMAREIIQEIMRIRLYDKSIESGGNLIGYMIYPQKIKELAEKHGVEIGG